MCFSIRGIRLVIKGTGNVITACERRCVRRTWLRNCNDKKTGFFCPHSGIWLLCILWFNRQRGVEGESSQLFHCIPNTCPTSAPLWPACGFHHYLGYGDEVTSTRVGTCFLMVDCQLSLIKLKILSLYSTPPPPKKKTVFPFVPYSISPKVYFIMP